jgi:hypothetical protein
LVRDADRVDGARGRVAVHLDEERRPRPRRLARAPSSARTRQTEDVLAGLVEVRGSLPELGQRSREYVEQVHAHTKVARKVLDIYERVMPISS